MYNLAIYSEDAFKSVMATDWVAGMLPPGYSERLNNCIVWTETDQGEEPARFVINTKLKRITFIIPKLISISGPFTIYSVLSDDMSSGTLRNIKKQYLIVESSYEY